MTTSGALRGGGGRRGHAGSERGDEVSGGQVAATSVVPVRFGGRYGVWVTAEHPASCKAADPRAWATGTRAAAGGAGAHR